MPKHAILKNQCKFCGIIGTKERPVKCGVCSICNRLKKEFPKVVKCFICGRPFKITFKENSERGNTCKKCDRMITDRVVLTGYRTLPSSRGEMEEFLKLLKN